MLTVSGLAKFIGERVLFEDLSLTITARDRVGIVGPNGSGKTTFLDIIASGREYDRGEVSIQRGATLGYLRQQPSITRERSLLAEVTAARTGAQRLEHKKQLIHERLAETTDTAEQHELMQELGELEHHYEHAGGYTTEYEARIILAGLGFEESDLERRMSEFSGGWIMRAELAKLLLTEPDILFLDEPTNHLDLDAILWFEKFLRDYAGAVIVISHDRAFLNRIATKILAFVPEGPKLYHGNYDEFQTARAKEREIIEATIKNQERFIDAETRFINRFRAKNTKATQVQSRIKRLEKLERVTELKRDKHVAFRPKPSPRSGKTVVTLHRLTFGYEPDRPLYRDLDLVLTRGEKMALVGPNGAGKSTLMKLLAGVLKPVSGTVTLGYNVTPFHYAQHQHEQLSDANTVIGELRQAALDESEEQLRTFLGAFLFSGDDVYKKVSVLSGGEKARLSLAKLFLRPANFILMDEPTNHLDIPSRDVLAEALATYDGALCLITHDRDLIDHAAERILEVDSGAVRDYPGNYSDYTYALKREQEASRYVPDAWSEGNPQSRRVREKDRKRGEAELRNRFYRESKRHRERIESIEGELERIGEEIKSIESDLADPSSFSDREQFNERLNEYERLKTKNETLNEEWLDLSVEVEDIRERVYGSESAT